MLQFRLYKHASEQGVEMAQSTAACSAHVAEWFARGAGTSGPKAAAARRVGGGGPRVGAGPWVGARTLVLVKTPRGSC